MNTSADTPPLNLLVRSDNPVEYKQNLLNNIKLKDEDESAWQRFIMSERGKVKTVADLQNKLAKYRQKISKMSQDDREDEVHDSGRLGDHLRAEGIPQPGPFWDAHAIIAGDHPEAWALRVDLAECEIGIDDSYNGCWLPRGSKYAGQQPFPKAVPHSRIHRFNYYLWLNIRFAGVSGQKSVMIERLRQTRHDLLYGTFPPEVMLSKGNWKLCYQKETGTNPMTTYRLLNNVFEFRNAYVDFRALRKQCGQLSVEFSQKNESLLDKIKNEWIPVGVEFKSDSKKASIPDISIWNMSCLVLSEKGKNTLEPLLRDSGELLALQDDYYLFNCLESASGDSIDASKTAFKVESENSTHIPKNLEFLPEKIAGKSLFKPGFALNTFLICQDEFKEAVENAQLGGVLFEKDLAQIFPKKP